MLTDKTAVYTAVNTVKEDTMEKLRKILNKIFIDGLSGMATGLFATLIIGTIISQIGSFIPGNIGTTSIRKFSTIKVKMTTS